MRISIALAHTTEITGNIIAAIILMLGHTMTTTVAITIKKDTIGEVTKKEAFKEKDFVLHRRDMEILTRENDLHQEDTIDMVVVTIDKL